MKKIITISLMMLSINSYAANVIYGHLPKNVPINAVAESPRENPVYKIDNLYVIVDSDFANSYPYKHIVLNAYIMGETFDNHRMKYKYQLLIQGYSKMPFLDKYKDIKGRFTEAKSDFYEFENGDEKDFRVTHDLIKHEKGEQFAITPTHDIPVTIYVYEFS